MVADATPRPPFHLFAEAVRGPPDRARRARIRGRTERRALALAESYGDDRADGAVAARFGQYPCPYPLPPGLLAPRELRPGEARQTRVHSGQEPAALRILGA